MMNKEKWLEASEKMLPHLEALGEIANEYGITLNMGAGYYLSAYAFCVVEKQPQDEHYKVELYRKGVYKILADETLLKGAHNETAQRTGCVSEDDTEK